MTTLFWILEYCKVLFAYIFIFFIWPAVIFQKFLNKKTKTFRFGFCVTAQIVIVNTVVLLLGLVHLLNPWLIRFLFYGSFLYCVIKRIPGKKEEGKRILRVLSGTLGIKSYCYRIGRILCDGIKKTGNRFWNAFRGRVWEYSVLAIVLLFGVIYFSYGAFRDFSYGFGDLYPHNAWIYGLTKGQIFSAGVYPEGMHCMIYAIHELFDIRIYSCLLFLQGMHSFVFLVSAYLMFREVFRWKYTPILALTLFLTLDVLCIDAVYSMSRLQWTLPQEFALFTPFMCVAFLVRYLRSSKEAPDTEITGKYKWIKKLIADENLLVFGLTIAASLVTHFYTTIMAFFLCVAFVPVAVFKIFHPKRFVMLVLAVVMGTTVALIPMIGALASGIPFQGSIGWAVNVINGVDGKGSENTTQNQENPMENPIEDSSVHQDSSATQIEDSSMMNHSQGDVTQVPVAEPVVVQPHKEPLMKRMKQLVKTKAETIYRDAYTTLYQQERGTLIVWLTVLSVVIFGAVRIIITVIGPGVKKRKTDITGYDNYFSLIFSTVLFMMIYCASTLGLPPLIEGTRVTALVHMLIVGMCFLPIDVAVTMLMKIASQNLEKVIGAVMVGGIYALTQITGTFHGYLYYELTRYNGAVMTTYDITEHLPDHSYTIVSTVDELYQMIQYGYHEEAVNFINSCINRNYTLPTEYVFIYLEKYPLQYGQSHFFAGPKWLAAQKYPEYYVSYVSQCPDVTSSELSKTLEKPPYIRLPVAASSYSSLEYRTIVESRLNGWCKEFSDLYPGELHTYYEDENFVCYYFKQNPACIYQLGFQMEEQSEN